jgi:hypothetical protein
MLVETTKYDLLKRKEGLLEEVAVLKAHCRFLNEVMVTAKDQVLKERDGMHNKNVNQETHKSLLFKIYKTEASVIACDNFIRQCNEKISALEEKINHCEILINSVSVPVTYQANTGKPLL